MQAQETKLIMNNLILVIRGRDKFIIQNLMLSMTRKWGTSNLFQNMITNNLPAAFFIFENASSYCSSFPASSDSVISDPAFCPPGTSSADDA